MTTTDIDIDAPFLLGAEEVARRLGVDPLDGLTAGEAAERLRAHGPNELAGEPPPSFVRLALAQVLDPMNLMLLLVGAGSVLIGEGSTAVLVFVLVAFNTVMGARQEMKAQASVAALAELQVPTAKVRRDGTLAERPATELVPGDIVSVEAGDRVPADGRILSSASLEVAEAALTGESVPVAKDPGVIDDPDASLGDRQNLVFQNTDVTRGSATFVVTATGAGTQMGRISDMVRNVERTRSPLQRELDGITKGLGTVAWVAVILIAVVGAARGLERDAVVLLAVSTAIAAIPVGMPTFVQMVLASGAKRLADAKAVVRSLTDVETLGATTAINSDKTGTLTMNEMMVVRMVVGGHRYRVEGSGYDTTGNVLGAAGAPERDFSRLGLGLALCTDATVAPDGSVVGDPTEIALVVLAAKVGVDAEATRRELPRRAAVPFDSAYKFMATFHDIDQGDGARLVGLVKGAPDVVIDRCTSVLLDGEIHPMGDTRDALLDANRALSSQGLRVLAFAVRTLPEDAGAAVVADPMGHVEELTFVGLVGMVDPLRPSAVASVATARRAGIEVRMITGDHTVTARAIADELGLAPGVASGAEVRALSDDELSARLDDLHVFGRTTPEDKLRLCRLMQDQGAVVAMTGDAVNDAAALKQADIGVAMGSGSEVSKQAARMVLTDDNFSTLVHAVELGRDVYQRVSAYLRFQLVGLFSVLLLMLLATAFDLNSGVALTPLMLLFVNFVVVPWVVAALTTAAPDPTVMDDPPRDPGERLLNPASGARWLLTGLVVGVAGLVPLFAGPDEPRTDGPSIAMTMTFAVYGAATVALGIVGRRDVDPVWRGPLLPFLGWIGVGALVVVLSVELGVLQRVLDTTSLTGLQWLAVLGLSLAGPLLLELTKIPRRMAAS